MPKLTYSATQGLVHSAGVGIDIEKTNSPVSHSGDAQTVNGTTGIITLEAETIAAGGFGDPQTITNDRVTVESVVLLSIASDSAATGIPTVTMVDGTVNNAGQFTFIIGNGHASGDVTAGDITVYYTVL